MVTNAMKDLYFRSKVPIGSVHGRFQPLHLEHLDYLLEAKLRCDFLYIGLTAFDMRTIRGPAESPHRKFGASNPLTYFERTRMIHDALVEANVPASTFAFTPFPIDDPDQLPCFLPTTVTSFTTICDEWNRRKIDLLSRAGYPVVVVREREPPTLRAGTIRDLLRRDDDAWTTMVPAAVARHLLSLQIRDRLVLLEIGDAVVSRSAS
jgi:nicotinamide mononucleotide adenylyltransferase